MYFATTEYWRCIKEYEWTGTHFLTEIMAEEYELYPIDRDVSNTMILYRGRSIFEPLYLNVRELGADGIPVQAKKSNLSEIDEVSYSKKTGFYDVPEFDRSDGSEEVLEMQEHRIDQLENEIEKISSVQEMQRWVVLFGGVIVGLIIMYALIFSNPNVLIT